MPTGLSAISFFLLLLLFGLSSAQEDKAGNIVFRLLCYNHSSALTLRGLSCDPRDTCDPELQFCLSQVGAEDCALTRVGFAFKNADRLGACSPLKEPNNLPDPVLIVAMTTQAMRLRLIIHDVDKNTFFERKFLIDDLRMNVEPKQLPTVADGQKFQTKDFVPLEVVSRAFKKDGRPSVQVGALVQCAPGRFGALCQVRCKANERYDCHSDGSRRCRLSWTGPTCDQRDFCAARPCKSWATCHSLAASFECSCNGRTGPQCRRDADPCLNHRCANSAPCLGVQGRPLCLCPPGLRGAECTERDLCLPNPCGQGRCRQNGSQVACDCPAGVTGRFCKSTALLQPLMPTAAVAKVAGLKEDQQQQQQEKQQEFPTLFVFIGSGVGVVLLASIVISLTCALRGRKKGEKCRPRKGPGPRLERACPVREQPLNPYNDAENIYEEPEAVYSTSDHEEAPPTPMCSAKGDSSRRMVFVRQDSRC